MDSATGYRGTCAKGRQVDGGRVGAAAEQRRSLETGRQEERSVWLLLDRPIPGPWALLPLVVVSGKGDRGSQAETPTVFCGPLGGAAPLGTLASPSGRPAETPGGRRPLGHRVPLQCPVPAPGAHNPCLRPCFPGAWAETTAGALGRGCDGHW